MNSFARLPGLRWLRSYEIVALLFALIVCGLLQLSPLPVSLLFAQSFAKRLLRFVIIVYFLASLITLVRVLWCETAENWLMPLRRSLLRELSQPYFTLAFLARTVRRGAAMLTVLFFFLHLKHIVLFVHRNNFDLFFWNLDRALHLGVQPNIAAMDWISQNPVAAVYFDWIYFVYFKYLLVTAVIFLLEVGGRELTDRFFFAYTLLWSLGGLLYLPLPADGPCYAVLTSKAINPADNWHLFRFPVSGEGTNSAYAAQFREMPIMKAKAYQQQLWHQRKVFLKGERFPGMFYGIAAFPSLHCAAVTMVLIFIVQLFRRFRHRGGIAEALAFSAMLLSGAFGLSICLGSVFLQWHYAVDGYTGILLASLVCSLGLRGWQAASPQTA